MFNIKLEEKSYKMIFKTLPVKIQQSKNLQRGGGWGGGGRREGLGMCIPFSQWQIGLKC